MLDHVGFAEKNIGRSKTFYEKALAALGIGLVMEVTAEETDGIDNGAPGLRPHYHPDYCGAFILDPDGHDVEAVCHRPE